MQRPTLPVGASAAIIPQSGPPLPDDVAIDEASSDEEEDPQPTKFHLPRQTSEQQAATGGGIFRGLWTPLATKPISQHAEHTIRILLPDRVKGQLHEAAAKYLHRVVDTTSSEATVTLPSLFADYPEDFGARKEDWVKLCARYISKADVRKINKVPSTSIRFSNLSIATQ